MLRKYLAATVLTLAALGTVSAVQAQPSPSNPDDKSIGDRIGDFGRSVFGIFSSDPKPSPAPKPSPDDSSQPPTKSTWTGSSTPSRFAPPQGNSAGPSPQGNSAGPSPQGNLASPPQDNLASPQRGLGTESMTRQRIASNLSDGYVPNVRNDDVNASQQVMQRRSPIQPPVAAPMEDHSVGYSVAGSDDALKPRPDAATEVIPVPRKVSEIRPSVALAQAGPESMPLYERMSAFRQSPFDNSNSAGSGLQAARDMQPAAATQTPSNGDNGNLPTIAPTAPPNMPMRAQTPTYVPAETRPIFPQRPAPSYTSSDTVIDGPSFSSPSNSDASASASRLNITTAPYRPVTAFSNPALAGPSPSMSAAVPPVKPANSPAALSTTYTAVSPSANFNSGAAALSDHSAERQSQGVLLIRQGPNLSVETAGPRRIAVGREATYEITMRNTGSVGAEELLVFIDLPAWAEVQRAEASLGTAQQAAASGAARQVRWRIGRLESQTFQRLTLKLVPRESQPLDLAIRWDYKQTSTQTIIEVQEPRLAVRIEGPREVLYGKKQIYKLKVANTGSGDAENTTIRLLPLGTGESIVANHNFGTIAAGAEKGIEVEMTARQAGLLTIKVEAQCEGGGRAEVAEPVLVRRAALAVRVEAPKIQFVGTSAVYRFHVSNPGNAAANNLALGVTVPPGVKLISSSDGGQADGDGTVVRWRIDSLGPAAEKIFELKCGFQQEGTARLELAATAEDELSVAANAATQVDAMANLVLDVVDPVGPIPVGEETSYELKVANRGTKSAEEIEVMAFFSQGIEPTTVEGGPHKIAPGQVTFDTIPSLGAGQELRLKINAKAQLPGNHIFRAEVHCRPLSTRVVREETTYFYANQGSVGQDAGIAGPREKGRDGEVPRSADRRVGVPGIDPTMPVRSFR